MNIPRSYALLVMAVMAACMMMQATATPAAEAVPMRYLTYQNFLQRNSPEHVRCMTMGKDGVLWLGTMNGLCTFDGYDLRPVAPDVIEGIVYCTEIQGDQLLIGCDKGLFSLDMKSGRISKVQGELTGEAICMTEFRGNVYIGSSDGLYVYDSRDEAIRRATNHGETMRDRILSLSGADNYLFVGGMKSIGKYDVRKGTYETIADNIILAGAMLVDGDRLWIGTATNLISVGLADGEITVTGNFPVVKAINRDSAGNLLLGTDAGLYVRGRNGRIDKVSHNASDMNSLAGESVWDIFIDDQDNAWLATERGLSMS